MYEIITAVTTPQFWISVASGIISSILFSIIIFLIIYNKWLKKIPRNTRIQMEEFLNARLEHETINHNAVLASIKSNSTPDNSVLSREHNEMKNTLQQLNDYAISEKTRREITSSLMNSNQNLISQSVDNLSAFSSVMKDLIKRNRELEQKVSKQKKIIIAFQQTEEEIEEEPQVVINNQQESHEQEETT